MIFLKKSYFYSSVFILLHLGNEKNNILRFFSNKFIQQTRLQRHFFVKNHNALLISSQIFVDVTKKVDFALDLIFKRSQNTINYFFKHEKLYDYEKVFFIICSLVDGRLVEYLGANFGDKGRR